MKNKYLKYVLVVGVLAGGVLLAVVLGGRVAVAPGHDSQGEKSEEDQIELLEVLHVFDGDTFTVRIDGKVESVRAIGIDAPETENGYREEECFGEQAAKRAVEFLGGKNVRLEADPTQENRDQYDRLLRYVRLEDGTFFNLAMVEEGFAAEYTFQDSKYLYQNDFMAAQQKAKEEKRGLWRECAQ